MLYSKYEDILFFLPFFLVYPNKTSTFAPKLITGVIAQLVEQRTENPCVPGSIPGGTTQKERPLVNHYKRSLFVYRQAISAKRPTTGISRPKKCAMPLPRLCRRQPFRRDK